MRDAIYFISDLHLGAPYLRGNRDSENRVVGFLDHIAHDAKAIYLLGDILDYWFEYKYVVPKGYIRFFGKLAQLADSGIEIIWVIGNHDIWIFDYLPKELGVKVVDGSYRFSYAGKNFYVAHGDRVWKGSLKYRFIQKLFRNKICQLLFSGIHPRWTVPFAYKWSGHSRSSFYKRESTCSDTVKHAFEHICQYCEEYNKQLSSKEKINYFLFGHLHVLKEKKLSDESTVYEIGDWITNFSYARYHGGEMQLLRAE